MHDAQRDARCPSRAVAQPKGLLSAVRVKVRSKGVRIRVRARVRVLAQG